MSSTHSRSSAEAVSAPIGPINTRASKSQQTMGTNDLDLVQSHLSHHDMPVANEFHEVDAGQYLRFSPTRKIVIVFVLSFCSFLAPISSTSILSGIPEVAKTYDTTGSIINASNALYLAFMGVSAPFWGPFSQVWGRRPIFLVSAFLFFAFSIGTALAPTLPSYFIFRILTAFQGTSFLVVGSSAIGDIYEPRARATALGWFLSGTLIGPAFGPFIGGVIITFCSWRVVFWLQTALGGCGTLLVFFFFPETYPHVDKSDLTEMSLSQKTKFLAHRINPVRVGVLLFTYPNLFFAGLAAGALVWNQYSLLTPIRYVLNPRFHLTSPIQSGLFYIAPGCGYLLGTFMGGRWADHTVKKWIQKRGRRVPEDRLKSCLVFLGVIIPGCILVYGWTVDQAVGGIPVPVLAMFLQGVAQLFCFPSLNTYCLDVMQAKGRSAEVVAGNYMFRYVFAALGSGLVLPAVEVIGVGWFSTISAVFLVAAGLCVWATTIFGDKWRDQIDAKDQRKAAARGEAGPVQEAEKKAEV
ncbi:hypothetical protein N7448_006977 [Penicillium atrosanguineum]|uniref:Uncharacterized protein n=1 Tax=Penicillium atrosanguineum TaxID=1132637 RepID=A0A9W9H0V7_9EURO|nr:Arsenical pump ATPase ArsA/Get3 [Penicillium atrosanguineum]KAJ5132819.1 hypothetical protein N7448_006977 [Penicillium atrosanguineum]KAJ5141292.1 hypothetical protein N7526_002287 [Penicillium atrosanguineum]KAJ5290485.1 Arsenical pump ATPase ArsA/Get3 [Penicillium atrosanguineum]KAJ5308307.1 hypothetical protein N7476_008963 [Penicillium atrosanguineum]